MVADAFQKMAQPGFMKEVGNVLGGYTAAASVDYGLDRFTSREIPDEISGVATVAGLEMAPVVSGTQMRRMQVGAGVYTGMAFADRLGIAESIKEAI